MRPPTSEINNYRFRYRQTPYEDRYYYVDIYIDDQWINFVKISQLYWKRVEWLFQRDMNSAQQDRLLYGFDHRCKEYNNYLDKMKDKYD